MVNEKYIRRLLIILAAVIVIANIITASASSSLFCATCHRGQAAALAKSGHSGQRCNRCHQRDNVFDVFAWRVNVLDMAARQVTFLYQRPVLADVPESGCISCHREVLDRTIVSGDIRVSHKAFGSSGVRCVSCHSSTAHPGATTSPKRPTMDKCSRCHNGSKASASCVTCHIKGVEERKRTSTTWRITHGRDWRRLHGMGDLNTCVVCHSANACLRCHNTVMPHPDFWIKLHSTDAKKDVDGCYLCHHKEFCNSCHGLEMPHRAGFLKRHRKEVSAIGKKACLRCHLQTGCDNCHVRHRHPGLEQERLKALKRGAGLE